MHDDALAELGVIDFGDVNEAGASPTIAALCERPLRMDAGAAWAITLLRGASASYLVFACHSGLLYRFSLQPLSEAFSQAYADANGALPERLGLDQQAVLDAERASLEPAQWRRDLAFWVRELGDGAFAWQPPRLGGEVGKSSFVVPLGRALSGELATLAESLGLNTEFLLQISLHVLLQKLSHQSVVITAHH